MAWQFPRLASFIGIALLAYAGGGSAASAPRPGMNPHLSPDQRVTPVLKAMTEDERSHLISIHFGDTESAFIMCPGALGSAGYGHAIKRFCLPARQESDAGLGVVKPVKIAIESHRRGFNVMLAGGTGLVRYPRNGRTFA